MAGHRTPVGKEAEDKATAEADEAEDKANTLEAVVASAVEAAKEDRAKTNNN